VFGVGEQIWSLAFSNSGSLLACYSLSNTLVWKAADWSLQVSAPNPREERAIEFSFDGDDCLMMVSEPRRVYKLQTREAWGSPLWQQQARHF
jgi:hypothetical protein